MTIEIAETRQAHINAVSEALESCWQDVVLRGESPLVVLPTCEPGVRQSAVEALLATRLEGEAHDAWLLKALDLVREDQIVWFVARDARIDGNGLVFVDSIRMGDLDCPNVMLGKELLDVFDSEDEAELYRARIMRGGS